MKPARFITLEGGEGTGKSTQAKRLAARLDARGIVTIATREPGGSPGAEEIRKLIVEGEPGRWDALTETLLLYAARADHVAKTIGPAMEKSFWVVSDRFADSTFVYQGKGRGLDEAQIASIGKAVLGPFVPDLTLILDLPVEEGLKRAHKRAGKETRFEQFDHAFHQRLRDGFLELAAREPQRCVLIDASGTAEEVEEKIWRAIVTRFGL
jgi:dTMP kinase